MTETLVKIAGIVLVSLVYIAIYRAASFEFAVIILLVQILLKL